MKGSLQDLQRQPRDTALWQQTQQRLLARRFEEAITGYRTLTKRYPAIPELWFELGNAAACALDFPLANQALKRAHDLSRQDSRLLGLIAQQYQNLRQPDDARACYTAALHANPHSIDAHIQLAVWFEKERKLDDAWECIETCLQRHPNDDQARYFRAFLLYRRHQLPEAESLLRDLIRSSPRYPYVQYAAPHLLGTVLDALGQYPEALSFLLEAKSRLRSLTDIHSLEQVYDQQSAQRQALVQNLTPQLLQRWKAEAHTNENHQPLAFLGGHPRSGTTLLEQVLDAHPSLIAFDESTAFAQEIQRPIESLLHPPSAQALDSLPLATRTHLRQRYLASLSREAPSSSPDALLLDKNPSATFALPIWLRLFPELKVIIALRDPRDIVISCFFLNLMLNATNVNFLSLDRTVRHYEDLMGLWLQMKQLGGFDWIESRYEDLVANLEREGSHTTQFLGLPWLESQATFHQAAESKHLYAPTYHDVTQPVYQRALGRWEHYREALHPYLDRLKPFCEAFGYPC